LTFVQETAIPGLLLLSRPTNRDDRGFFREVFHMDELEAACGCQFGVRQWNHSMSRPGVIRALHAENWNKLVYPVTGRMFAAIADIRPESPTFARVETITFDEAEHKALFIPKGLANSICVLGDAPVHYLYLVDAYYDGKDTRAVAWDDPDLAIAWPIENPILSQRDRSNPTLRQLFPDKFGGKQETV
jgi:dTDP-4-dehydrorhamnose 3,5-epimerase